MKDNLILCGCRRNVGFCWWRKRDRKMSTLHKYRHMNQQQKQTLNNTTQHTRHRWRCVCRPNHLKTHIVFIVYLYIIYCDRAIIVFVIQQGVPLSLSANFDLRSHVEALGHNVSGCMGVNLSSRRCGGFLTKRGGRVKTWRRRWFIFDLDHQRLAYYTGETERLKSVTSRDLEGGAVFGCLVRTLE